ncbi:MAG TPA: DUF305 domain-containing protein [Longimicrobium sp.]|nr:DUF305 domain-containing protein [Longimicrobium sp.]
MQQSVMEKSWSAESRVALLACALLAACGGGTTPPAPAPAPAPAASPPAGHVHAPAGEARVMDPDIRFMQRMIAHHGQALEMTALVEERTGRRDLYLLAGRMDVSQKDEIAWMQRWLRERGAAVPDPHAHHGEHEGMPGMLTEAEMAAMRAASGQEFDRRFLEGMIRHHQGALAMVSELFATPGAAQRPEVFQFANDVDADQRAEIARMQALLGVPQP